MQTGLLINKKSTAIRPVVDESVFKIFQVSAHMLDFVRDTSDPNTELLTLPLGPSLNQCGVLLFIVKGLSRCQGMPSFEWTTMGSVLHRVWHGQSLVSERFECGTGTV